VASSWARRATMMVLEPGGAGAYAAFRWGNQRSPDYDVLDSIY